MAKKPDGLTLVPCKAGKALTWDVTIVDTFAASYFKVSPVSSVQAAEAAADRKKVKYTVSTNHWFIPVAVEIMGSINQEGSAFLDEVGNRIAEISDDPREHTFLHQTLSIIIQRFNAIAFRGILLTRPTQKDDHSRRF